MVTSKSRLVWLLAGISLVLAVSTGTGDSEALSGCSRGQAFATQLRLWQSDHDTETKLGPHEKEVSIGKGGIGEVYRAKDTRLERTVKQD
jgi:hypothetical protein